MTMKNLDTIRDKLEKADMKLVIRKGKAMSPIQLYVNSKSATGIEINASDNTIRGCTRDDTGMVYDDLPARLVGFVNECKELAGITTEAVECANVSDDECIDVVAEVVETVTDTKTKPKKTAAVTKVKSMSDEKMKKLIASKREKAVAKTEFRVGLIESAAMQYDLPPELANLYFMKLNDSLYIKNPGLLFLASKKGYSSIEVTSVHDEKANSWSSETKIYPIVTPEMIEAIAKLDGSIQKQALDIVSKPTNGTGGANKTSVKMSTMHVYLKEMSQTRSQNRALRAFTGYGGCSAEELDSCELDVE